MLNTIPLVTVLIDQYIDLRYIDNYTFLRYRSTWAFQHTFTGLIQTFTGTVDFVKYATFYRGKSNNTCHISGSESDL